jgi:hypothetical protein
MVMENRSNENLLPFIRGNRSPRIPSAQSSLTVLIWDIAAGSGHFAPKIANKQAISMFKSGTNVARVHQHRTLK